MVQPFTPMCVSTVYSVLSRALWTKNTVILLGWDLNWWPLQILEQCLTKCEHHIVKKGIHRTESTEYTVLTHIGVRAKQNNILYPGANQTSITLLKQKFYKASSCIEMF